jgi:hypothetical protein
MTFDFRASQLRTSKIIVSGSTGTNAKLLLYPISVDGSPLNQGNIDPTLFGTGSIGQDVFLYVSGVIGGTGNTGNGITLFGGDVASSGNIKAEGDIRAANVSATTLLDALSVRGVQFYGNNNPNFYFYLMGSKATFNVVSYYGGGIANIRSQGNISFQDGSSYSGSLSASLTGERTWQMPDDSGDVLITSRVLAGYGLTVTSYSNGYVALSNSLSPSIFSISGSYAKTPYLLSVDPDGRYATNIGTDVGWFVSGSSIAKSVFGGDLLVSGAATLGTVFVQSTAFFSSSIQQTGSFYLLGQIQQTGAITRTGAFSSSGSHSITESLAVSGTCTLSGSLYHLGNEVKSGNLIVTGSINSSTGFSGSLQRLADGSAAFVAGPNITVDLNSNGTVVISGSSPTFYQPIAGYNYTTATSSTTCGIAAYTPSEVPSSSIYLRVVLTSFTASNYACVKLYNHTSGAFVAIGGTGITVLSSSATTPTKIDSVNLVSATNWSTGSSVYELQLLSSGSSVLSVLGSGMFVFS